MNNRSAISERLDISASRIAEHKPEFPIRTSDSHIVRFACLEHSEVATKTGPSGISAVPTALFPHPASPACCRATVSRTLLLLNSVEIPTRTRSAQYRNHYLKCAPLKSTNHFMSSYICVKARGFSQADQAVKQVITPRTEEGPDCGLVGGRATTHTISARSAHGAVIPCFLGL
jgi:hypothetical protein